MFMTRIAAARFVDRIFRIVAIETLAVVRLARPRFGIHRQRAREAGLASRSLPDTA